MSNPKRFDDVHLTAVEQDPDDSLTLIDPMRVIPILN
jgi:hypothetical protein